MNADRNGTKLQGAASSDLQGQVEEGVTATVHAVTEALHKDGA